MDRLLKKINFNSYFAYFLTRKFCFSFYWVLLKMAFLACFVIVNTAAYCGPQTYFLQGSLDFGEANIGTLENYRKLSIKNNGDSNLIINRWEPDYSSDASNEFKIVWINSDPSSFISFPITLAPNKTVTLTVAFQPQRPGARTSYIKFYTNDRIGPYNLSVSGVGINPYASTPSPTITPTSTFTNTPIPTTTPTYTLTPRPTPIQPVEIVFNVSLANKVVKIGDVFEIPIRIETSMELFSFTFEIAYDNSVLKYEGFGEGDYRITPFFNSTGNTILSAHAGLESVSGNGNLFSLKFSALRQSDGSELNFLKAEIDGNEEYVKAINGVVRVLENDETTPNPTATVTPTPFPTNTQNGLVFISEFDDLSQKSNWTELPGGFNQNTAGTLFPNIDAISEYIPSSLDRIGTVITVDPGEVTTLLSSQEINLGETPAFVRARLYSDNTNAQLFIGLLQKYPFDGSLGMMQYANSSRFAGTEGWITAFYQPDTGGKVVPFIQVVGFGSDTTNVLFDRFEVYSISESFVFPNSSILNDQTVLMPQPLGGSEFNTATIGEIGWMEIPGGFGGAIPGELKSGVSLFVQIPSSLDKKSLEIQVDPGEITFLTTKSGIDVGRTPILISVSARASGPNAQIAVGAVQGDLGRGQNIEGSLGMNMSISTASHASREKRILAYFEPNTSSTVSPFIQVTGNGNTSTTVLIDRIEVYTLKPSN